MRALHQAVAVAAMCLQEEPNVRPLITDVVSALGVLGTSGPDHASTTSFDDPCPLSDHNMIMTTNGSLLDDESIRERQRAVAEAIEWGSTTRHNASRCGSTSSV